MRTEQKMPALFCYITFGRETICFDKYLVCHIRVRFDMSVRMPHPVRFVTCLYFYSIGTKIGIRRKCLIEPRQCKIS
jgi:hypothetical protein